MQHSDFYDIAKIDKNLIEIRNLQIIVKQLRTLQLMF